jgi:hypothetical protein
MPKKRYDVAEMISCGIEDALAQRYNQAMRRAFSVRRRSSRRLVVRATKILDDDAPEEWVLVTCERMQPQPKIR